MDNEKREEKEWEGFVLDGMTLEAQEAIRVYKREYRRRNREKINRQHREWCAKNPEMVKMYQTRYWENKAKNKVRTREQG